MVNYVYGGGGGQPTFLVTNHWKELGGSIFPANKHGLLESLSPAILMRYAEVKSV